MRSERSTENSSEGVAAQPRTHWPRDGETGYPLTLKKKKKSEVISVNLVSESLIGHFPENPVIIMTAKKIIPKVQVVVGLQYNFK